MTAFRRKLFAFSYANWETFNYNDETEWRNMIVWLENQKLRNYKIEDRAALCDINSAEWPAAFRKYLQDLDCELDDEAIASRFFVCDWLLNQAVHFEFSDNYESLKQASQTRAEEVDMTPVSSEANATDATTKAKDASTNPFEHLDFETEEFRLRTRKLCDLLQIAPHANSKEELVAACTLIAERLSTAGLARFDAEHGRKKVDLLPLPLVQATLAETIREGEGNLQDSIIDNVSRILRVLHVCELRLLQTNINQAIVELQKITANPKTDESLGKVGY